MRILLVEDDDLLGRGVARGLELEGHAVDWVRDGVLAMHAVAGDGHDVIVLDLGLPGRDGMVVLRALRERGAATPVLILTARDAVEDRVAGLDAGADDYLVKPFDLDELSARLRALLRRGAGRASGVIRHGDVELDPAAHTVTRGGVDVPVTRREFAVLWKLFDNAGRVLSRGQLEEALYGWDEGVESNAVQVHIHHLRRKLGRDLIRTVRGVGYVVPRDAGGAR